MTIVEFIRIYDDRSTMLKKRVLEYPGASKKHFLVRFNVQYKFLLSEK